MNVNVVFNFSIKTAEIINGNPSPNEYVNNNSIPCIAVCDVLAIISAEPKKAPVQGVILIEKTIPNKNAENKLFTSTDLLFPFKKGIRIISK